MGRISLGWGGFFFFNHFHPLTRVKGTRSGAASSASAKWKSVWRSVELAFKLPGKRCSTVGGLNPGYRSLPATA